MNSSREQTLRRWLWWAAAYLLVVFALLALDGAVPSPPAVEVHWAD